MRRLVRGFEKRRSAGGAAREQIEVQLVATLEELMATRPAELPEPLESPPPRPIAQAMALALFSQPHVEVTFGEQAEDGTEVLPTPIAHLFDKPLVVPSEILEAALGIAQWELDDLRDEVDRRAGRTLKQARVLQWLWTRFGLPKSGAAGLFRVLFPGVSRPAGEVGLLRRGAQLYAVLDQDPPPELSTLYLGWIVPRGERSHPPLGTFRGRFVDPGLRSTIGRSVGADDDEVIDLLDRMVTIVPRARSGAFLAHDHWRSGAGAAITELCAAYPECTWLVRPLQPEEIDTSDWIALRGEQIAIRNVRRTFDAIAVPRAQAMTECLYGELLARLDAEPADDAPLGVDHLDLYDMGGHLRAVLAPIVDWARSARTAAIVADRLGVREEEAARALEKVVEIWTEHVETTWVGPPRDARGDSVQVLLTSHLLASQAALRRLLRTEPLPEFAHRDVLVLFAAHTFASTSIEQLWADRTAIPDPIGRWFWAAWQRVVDLHMQDAPSQSGTFDITLG